MPALRLPLSGDFPPIFTVNLGESSNPDIERDALTVASYGRQLGRIEDALIVLLRHLQPKEELSEEERKAIHDFKLMVEELADVRDRRSLRPTLRP